MQRDFVSDQSIPTGISERRVAQFAPELFPSILAGAGLAVHSAFVNCEGIVGPVLSTAEFAHEGIRIKVGPNGVDVEVVLAQCVQLRELDQSSVVLQTNVAIHIPTYVPVGV